jgi:hypothetical protein
VNLIGSLLRQLLQKKPMVSDKLKAVYHHTHTDPRYRPTLGELSELLKQEIDQYEKVFVLIDALDEYSEANDARHAFLAELQKLGPSLYLLVTSRFSSTIEHEFKDVARVEIIASDKDIETYVDGRIDKNSSGLARHVRKYPNLRKDIVSTVIEKAKGM